MNPPNVAQTMLKLTMFKEGMPGEFSIEEECQAALDGQASVSLLLSRILWREQCS